MYPKQQDHITLQLNHTDSYFINHNCVNNMYFFFFAVGRTDENWTRRARHTSEQCTENNCCQRMLLSCIHCKSYLLPYNLHVNHENQGYKLFLEAEYS